MNKLPILSIGDSVEIIAPASRSSDSQLLGLKELLESWELNCIVQKDIFAPDLLCANTDEMRFTHLKNALQNPKTKAVICVRGGYGSTRLIPRLAEIHPPDAVKIFIGISDVTCLHLYLQQHWGWPTIHGAAAPDKFSKETIAAVKSILFGEAPIQFTGLIPMNRHAQEDGFIKSHVTGGNLAIIQSGVGTSWQIDGRDKIILLEEIGERGYRVDRMLEHLKQASLFSHAAAIILGDFLEGDEPNGSSLVEPVLQRFAESCPIPVLRIAGIGHGPINFPIPFGTEAHLQLGKKAQLTCFR
ncbi:MULTISPECIES: S66 peptidase family protein [Legionella]|uniref:LD-carboxypeptidase n=1 Tax=Legionella resiliens TaxID=2905958 RepID=A0ABS8WWB6_9GAMM|nr:MULTISPECIES: LD-carboxypeptidase [unclassified Legionella]MCE0721607.1 LD-carboxypeptidase [Legionella sp. 9fVS26]MCE3530761.1 LD-carboxypeptidase [Legionella sp. 8cVS16]QLZ70322.1 LD-carboxypeptidase [Legionella sp. PC1000]